MRLSAVTTDLYMLLRMRYRRHHFCICNIQHVSIVVNTACPSKNSEQFMFLEIAELILGGEVGVSKDLMQQ